MRKRIECLLNFKNMQSDCSFSSNDKRILLNSRLSTVQKKRARKPCLRIVKYLLDTKRFIMLLYYTCSRISLETPIREMGLYISGVLFGPLL